jgi:hypothetical protein
VTIRFLSVNAVRKQPKTAQRLRFDFPMFVGFSWFASVRVWVEKRLLTEMLQVRVPPGEPNLTPGDAG